ncbi:hypothetical protein MUK42_16488 [Musa troglodytarum]|uniref:Uncharacterized protein n=1 Tax=Musa troglodytarum TaxID=320322 RepID=A0A9E7KW64_9LILI|nr:hypothetical protein MUK42_16488 [Musa troglodytarum]
MRSTASAKARGLYGETLAPPSLVLSVAFGFRRAVDGDLVLSGSTIGMQWLMADVIGVHHGFLIYSAGSRHQKGTHLGPAS